jgi:hypothetical protein
MTAINRRSAVLAAIVVFGTLSIVVHARQAMPQGPTPASLKAAAIEKVRDNLYVITGSSVAVRLHSLARFCGDHQHDGNHHTIRGHSQHAASIE